MTRVESHRSNVRLLVLFLPALILASIPIPLRAEEAQDSPSGFSLGQPRVFIGGHAGINFPQAGSDIFSLVTRELTLEKSDFRAAIGGFDFGVPIGSRFAAVFSYEYSRVSPHSESRNFVQDNGDPIRQITHFSQMPVTATLRFYPIKTGETAGSYAWVPTRVVPYIGGGIGFVRYSFSQSGDFVDNQTLNIFSADFESSGFATIKHVVAGVDISLTPRIFANLEGRYSWAQADLHGDFRGFAPIDLDGLRAVAGICFRF